MGASNEKSVFIKVVSISKNFKMVTNSMSFGFKMIKYKYNIITKCLVISPKTNPMKWGKEGAKV